MSLGQIVLMVFGLLMLIGGFFGNRAGSKVSLYAGSGSAALLFVAVLVSVMDMRFGLGMGIVIAALLCVVFGVRFLKTRKIMPSGMMLGVSILALVLLAFSLI
jgi:uncharacterized membrane protein (UPF0136 family)